MGPIMREFDAAIDWGFYRTIPGNPESKMDGPYIYGLKGIGIGESDEECEDRYAIRTQIAMEHLERLFAKTIRTRRIKL